MYVYVKSINTFQHNKRESLTIFQNQDQNVHDERVRFESANLCGFFSTRRTFFSFLINYGTLKQTQFLLVDPLYRTIQRGVSLYNQIL